MTQSIDVYVSPGLNELMHLNGPREDELTEFIIKNDAE